MRHPIGFAVAMCTILGCGSPGPTRSAATVTATAETVSAPRAASGATTAPPVVQGPPAPSQRCRLTVTDTEGCRPRDVEEVIAPVRRRLENCRGTSGGKVAVHVRKAAGKVAFDIEPGSSLDPREKQCVLDALSSLQSDESSTAWAGVGLRPSGFTSLITLEW